MLRVPSLSIGRAGYWLRVVLVVVAIAQRSLGHSQDETEIGFAFPKEEREALVAARPDVFFLPCESELRFPWIEAWLDALDVDEMRELVLNEWRMVVPQRVAREVLGPPAAGHKVGSDRVAITHQVPWTGR
jgi:hypothetical protein